MPKPNQTCIVHTTQNANIINTNTDRKILKNFKYLSLIDKIKHSIDTHSSKPIKSYRYPKFINKRYEFKFRKFWKVVLFAFDFSYMGSTEESARSRGL